VERTALVLAGGGARAAYEAGVVHYLFHEVADALGRPPRVDVLCGSSAGAVNCSALAAHADDQRAASELLVHGWSGLEIERMLAVDPGRLLGLFRSLLLRPGMWPVGVRFAAVLDPAPIAKLLSEQVPFEKIAVHLERRRLDAVALLATHVATGRSTLFLQAREGDRPAPTDGVREVRSVSLEPCHALASAAIPLLFPPVRVGGELYCDGSLRQDLPLSPAVALGASRLLVVSPHSSPAQETPDELRRARERVCSDPVYLAGKALEALILDRIDEDLERIRERNDLVDHVARLAGNSVLRRLDDSLARAGGQRARRVETVCLRPSRRIGQLAAAHVKSRAFRGGPFGVAGRLVRAFSDDLPEADLVSYLLFDGAFARLLIELGRADARAHHDELCALFASGALAASGQSSS
jgi:NTE family protein